MQINSEAKTVVFSGKDEQLIALAEYRAFETMHPNFVRCPENLNCMSDYLAGRSLLPTYPNLRAAYEDLLQAGVLHVTAPLPSGPRKSQIKQYTGSHYDRAEISKLKAQIAQMTSSEMKAFMAANGWSDWPLWLQV
jgi:hypothetical protein